MIRFARLFDEIDQTTSTNAKVSAMTRYFASAPPADAAWAVFFLTGRRLKRLVPSASIRDWALSATGLEPWILNECYAVVGDGAETAALMLDQVPREHTEDLPLAQWVEQRILPLRQMDAPAQQARVTSWWRSLDRLQRFILLKLLTGELRVGVSQTLVSRALAQAAGLPVTSIAARLMGEWTPHAAWYASLLSQAPTDEDRSRPYPFFLASPLEGGIEALGDPAAWVVEWKWDGIRAQLVRRGDAVHLWTLRTAGRVYSRTLRTAGRVYSRTLRTAGRVCSRILRTADRVYSRALRTAERFYSRTRRPPQRRSACRLSSLRRRGPSSRNCARDRARVAWKG
ncbi:MAG: hypothetical protein LC804_26715 [Acidobacteria bacterium]|nr:hypothetical protein [Acidobacteriota bacterium]